MTGKQAEPCESLPATRPPLPRPPASVPRWTILFQDSGELGNRLVTYAHLIALAMEYRVPVVNLAFWRYNGLFEGSPALRKRPWTYPLAPPSERQLPTAPRPTRGTPWLLQVPILGGWLRRRCTFDGRLVLAPGDLWQRTAALTLARAHHWPGTRRVLHGFCWVRDEKIDGHMFSLCLPKGTSAGWTFNPGLIEKHAETVRALFRPTATSRQQIGSLIWSLRKRFSRLVGVHVRRGDYCRYKGGRWHYPDAVYRRVMTSVAGLYPQDKVGFLVASDGPVDAEAFAPLPIAHAPGNLIADMYSLAECDAILAPPSTFSGWASFMGKVPIYWIRDEHAVPRLEDMKQPWTPCWY